MIWDGTRVYCEWGYRPVTRPSIKWHRVANGDWRGSDRGSAEDVFESDIVFRGPISELTDLETVLTNNRDEFDIVLGDGEEIFGADLDYSSAISATIIDYGKIRKTAFKVFEMAFRLRYVGTPSFLSVTPDFSILRKASHSDTRESEFDITKHFTYDNVGYAADHESDPGTYRALFTQTTEEMKAIRRYLLVTARASTIVLPSFDNMSYPFGTRMGTGPFNVKVIEWRETGRSNLCDWGLSIAFGREF